MSPRAAMRPSEKNLARSMASSPEKKPAKAKPEPQPVGVESGKSSNAAKGDDAFFEEF